MTPKRILVIDDEFQITRVLKRSLGAHRYDVRTAADGESGLDTFSDFHPDLVITDLSMPGMSGIEVCKAIRRMSDVPIIVLSVKGEEQTKVEALDAGADDFITKPFGMNELLAYLIEHHDRVITDRSLLSNIWVGDYTEQTEYLRVFIGNLRKKIEPTPSKPRYILTEPWVGYRFTPSK